MEEINLMEYDGVLLEEEEMQIGAILFAYSEMFENMSLVKIDENNKVVILDSVTLSEVTENLTNFKQFLNKAKLFCEKKNWNYEDLWDKIITNNDLETLENVINFKQSSNQVELFCKNENCKYEDLWNKTRNNDLKFLKKYNSNFLKKLQKTNSDPEFNPNRETGINF